MSGGVTKWERSSFCSDSACVEVAALAGGRVAMRDSKQKDGLPIVMSADDWNGFLHWLSNSSPAK
jgi:hypothetical protein